MRRDKHTKELPMLKKVLLPLILIVGGIAISRVDVDAHLEGYTYSPTIRHVSSYDCTLNAEQVGNLDQHPALFRCEPIATNYETLCRNPNGRVTFGNNIQAIDLSGESEVGEGNITDRTAGNKATVVVDIDDTDLLAAANQTCIDRNRNWTLYKEFVKVWEVFLRTYDLECPASEPGCSLPRPAWAAQLHCTVPVNPANNLTYTLDPRVNNPPPATPLEYLCVLVAEQHCDGIEPCLPSPFALRQDRGPLEQRYTLLAELHSLWNQPRKVLSPGRS
jgi:hypothetical protein